MDSNLLDMLTKQLGAEVACTASCLLDKYGEVMSIEDYANLMEVKVKTVHDKISNETLPLMPVKIGKKNKFATIEVAKLFHN